MTSTSSSQFLNENILYELDKLNCSFVKRRITNELTDFIKQDAYINIDYNEDSQNINNSDVKVFQI